jgi:hypothetical protein
VNLLRAAQHNPAFIESRDLEFSCSKVTTWINLWIYAGGHLCFFFFLNRKSRCIFRRPRLMHYFEWIFSMTIVQACVSVVQFLVLIEVIGGNRAARMLSHDKLYSYVPLRIVGVTPAVLLP